MEDAIFTVVSEIAKCLLGPIRRQLSYLCYYSSNIENLKKEVEKLKAERASIQHRVDEAKRQGEQIEENVENWRTRVNNTICEVEDFVNEEGEAKKRCFMQLCPNLKSRYQHSKKATAEVKTIVELLEDARKFQYVSYRVIPEQIWLTSNRGYEAFESRLSTLKNIRNALTDPNVSIIGLYGMGGIGKTTLVKEVARQAKEDKLFDQVVFAEVSQTADIKKIQGEIAEKLGLELHEETESGRASRLHQRLQDEKDILIILDNMWGYLNLETVGIPYGEDHKGCKLLLASRDRNALLSMGSIDNFPLDVLNEEEAWRLFKKMTSDDVENRKMKSTAMDVAKACKGLPIAIVTVSRALRKKSLAEWRNALRELQTPTSANFEGLPAEAYSAIELSYKYLKGELKKTFLLCSLLSYLDLTLDELFKYGMGLGIFQGTNRMEDAKNKVNKLINELVDSCLLLEGGGNVIISLHDVVRDVAISIAYRDEYVFVVKSEDVWEWPDKDTLEKCTAIYIRDSNIDELPEGLECPQLEFFLMESKDPFVHIPENFFLGMRKLKVVDLSHMRLASLPSSLGVLTNLRTLCLDFGVFEDLAIIGNLKNLEILSFMGSIFAKLPKELGQLTKLRFLDLSHCSKLKVIEPNVISSLIRLEELVMSNCFLEWEAGGLNGERSNASLDELMHLRRLTCLVIHIKDDKILPIGFFSKKLERYKISIGDGLVRSSLTISTDLWFRFSLLLDLLQVQYEMSRTLELKLKSSIISSENLQGFKNVEYLCLDELQGVKNILFKLDSEGFAQLKHLIVQNNPELCLTDSIKTVRYDAFPVLEVLILQNLMNLEKICQDQLKADSFTELSTIKVKNCDKLTNVFSLATTKCLPRLQRIVVIDCKNIEDIFAFGDEGGNIDKIKFSQLSCLSLGTLPQLASFFCEVKTPSISRKRREELTSAPLFNEKVLLPKLEAMELYEINVEQIWHNQLPASFRCLTRLIIWKCDKLKYVFSPSTLGSFEQLQHLEICYCMGLQEIIADEQGADEVTPNFVFRQVATLILSNLTELRYFYPGKHTSEWPALKILEAHSCHRVKIFASELSSFQKSNEENDQLTQQPPLFMVEKVFPNLEDLKLSGKDFPMIWQGECPQHLLDRLKALEILNDESAVFPLALLEKFHNLEQLRLTASSYNEIFANGGQLEKQVKKLPQIKYLQLFALYNLKHMWQPDSKLNFFFQNLLRLSVSNCQNLINLGPSSVSFQNLTQLHVFDCKELINLLTSSVAKSLVRLVNLTVTRCSTMTEVVVSGGDEAKEEIVFSKLKWLHLSYLPSLTSFCSGNCTFKFPSLEDLVLIMCPQINIFTGGELSTPTVNVRYGEEVDKWRWEGDLNTTIRQLHKEKELEGCGDLSTIGSQAFLQEMLDRVSV